MRRLFLFVRFRCARDRAHTRDCARATIVQFQHRGVRSAGRGRQGPGRRPGAGSNISQLQYQRLPIRDDQRRVARLPSATKPKRASESGSISTLSPPSISSTCSRRRARRSGDLKLRIIPFTATLRSCLWATVPSSRTSARASACSAWRYSETGNFVATDGVTIVTGQLRRQRRGGRSGDSRGCSVSVWPGLDRRRIPVSVGEGQSSRRSRVRRHGD